MLTIEVAGLNLTTPKLNQSIPTAAVILNGPHKDPNLVQSWSVPMGSSDPPLVIALFCSGQNWGHSVQGYVL